MSTNAQRKLRGVAHEGTETLANSKKVEDPEDPEVVLCEDGLEGW